MRKIRQRRLLTGAISLLVCFLAITLTPSAQAQISLIGDGAAANTGSLRPSGVDRYGSLEVAWVTSPLTGKELFQVAAPTVIDRSDLSQAQMAVEVRADNIEDLIWLETTRFREQAIDGLFNAEAKLDVRSVEVFASTLQKLPVVQIKEGKNSRPLTIATVTAADADFYSQKPEQVVEQWKTAVEDEILTIQELYSAPSLRQRLRETVNILLGLVAMSIALIFIRWRLGKEQRRLKKKRAEEANKAAALKTQDFTQTPPVSPAQLAVNQPRTADKEPISASANPIEAVTTNQQQAEIDSQQSRSFMERQLSQVHWIDVYKFVQWVLLWAIILGWYVGIYLIATRLPSLMRWSSKVLTQPLSLIMIWFSVSLAIRVSSFLIQRSLSSWTKQTYLSFGDTQRKVVRSRTITGAFEGLATCIFLILGVLLTLIEFGLPSTSIFAGSALIGLAVSFGAQNLVKDLVNGCLILLEDQFAVGDFITANGESGFVEQLNLRLTQLRSVEGDLISIPNSTISLVNNKSSTWSCVNLGVDVAYDTDLDYAIAVLHNTATQMSQDAHWQSLILEPPKVLGVDSFNDSSITIRLTMRTEPAQQWLVARELRRRLKQALDEANISIPFPQSEIWFKNKLPLSEK